MTAPKTNGTCSNSVWTALLVVALIWLGFALSVQINQPWVTSLGFNGAVWSQSAHNILRAGLFETLGASTGFYFGPLPIPAWGYYLHHPPLLHLILAGLFAILGEHEWVARILPIGCSLGSAILLWLLVRSCAGSRAATLATAVFSSLPMELRYGKMVNFEPVVLMFILGALWSIRKFEISSDVRWKIAAALFVVIGLWVDWAMYLFVVSLWLCVRYRSDARTRRFATSLLLIAGLSALLYLFRIHFLRADAWTNLTDTLIYRMGGDHRSRFTELEWLRKVGGSLGVHFLPLGCGLALFGLAVILRRKDRDNGTRFLALACASVALMDAIFLVVFQNDSYIHQYIGFYFLFPISVLGGIALDQMIVRSRDIFSHRHLEKIGAATVCLVLLFLVSDGTKQEQALRRQFHILGYDSSEPIDLIPKLGAAIQENFSPDTMVLCNFLPDYGPQVEYYAQRELLNNLPDYNSWNKFLHHRRKRVGGVVWLGSSRAGDIIARLPSGRKRVIKFDNLSFCFWRPDTGTSL